MPRAAISLLFINDLGRCQHRTITGKCCRLRVVDSRSSLYYAPLQFGAGKTADLRAALAGQTTQFEDAQEVNKLLSNLLILHTENRVSPRCAAVMVYTCNLILRTLSVRIQELRAYCYDDPVRPDLSAMPRPNRDAPPTIPAEASRPS